MIIAKTPLRISYVGGGTDLPEFCDRDTGAVMSAAINKYVYVVAQLRHDKMYRISWTCLDYTSVLDDIRHDIIREAIALFLPSNYGIEIHTMADIPTAGAGLGSSAAITVCTILAIHALLGRTISLEELLESAFYIEHDILHRHVGRQDHAATVYGGTNIFTFNGNKVGKTSCRLDGHVEEATLLFDTGEIHDAEYILSTQAKDVWSRRHQYVRLADCAAKLMLPYAILLEELSNAVKEGYAIKRTLAVNIETDRISRMIDLCERNGASAAKVLGAGGGGYIMCIAPTGIAKRQITIAMEKEFSVKPLDFQFVYKGSHVIAL